MIAIFSIPGTPRVLKNSKQPIINKATGKMMFIPSKVAGKAMKYALSCVRGQMSDELKRTPYSGKVWMKAKFFGAWKSGGGNVPDLSNLYQLPEDVLQAAGVIEDDRQIESHDGSRRYCLCDTCSERPVIKSGPRAGQRKEDCGAVKKCPFERTIIEIYPDMEEYK